MQGQKLLKLSSQWSMPMIGLGTREEPNEEEIVYSAIKLGYRHIDTASLYANEVQIGRAIRKAIEEKLVTREDLFITTKFWNDEKEKLKEALQGSLSRLQLDYVDLYLIHWPGGYFGESGKFKSVPVFKLWEQMESFVEEKLVRSIGVSNFNVQSITDLASYAKIMPAVNQIELHPYLQQKNLVQCCQYFGIAVVAFSPLCRGGKREWNGQLINIFQEQTLITLAQKYNRTIAQVILNWAVSLGCAVIPRASSEERLLQNLNCSDFTLSEEDTKLINGLESNIRMIQSTAKLRFDYFA